jgi:hypothetical protein
MKLRIIVSLLVLVLGLSGCGSVETAEAIATSAVTTAATFETTTAETTTIMTITETTASTIYNDDEETLKNLITEQTDKELLLWEYDDFDNDGAFEAFAFPGEINEYNQKRGTLFLVNSNGLNELHSETSGVDVFTFSFDEYTFAAMVYYGTHDYSRIWGVDGKEAYEPPISRIGQSFTITGDGEMTITQSAFDNFTMSNDNVNGAHTWKPYYFYYDNGFKEYGGSEITLEELLTYENAGTYIDEIKNLNGEISNILLRGNSIININYRVQDPEVDYLKWNYYYTLKITDEKVIHITDNPDKPEWDDGVYLPALLPDIAVYSGVLYPVYQDGSYDYIDKTGKVVIDGNFDTAEFFSEGFGVVSKDGKYGAINVNGDITVPLKYSKMQPFSCGLSLVKNDEEFYGYVDYHGNEKIPFIYGFARDFSENIAIVGEDEYGDVQFINRNGDIIWEGVLGGLPYWGDFHDGYMRQGNVIYDKSGNEFFANASRFPLVEIKNPRDFSEGYAVIPRYHKYFFDFPDGETMNFFYGDNWYYFYIDTNGENAFDKTFDIAGSFSEGLAAVKKDGKTGVIDTSGEVIFYIDGIDPWWYEYSDGLLAFRKIDDLKYGFLDRNGEITVPAVYDYIVREFYYGLALVELDGKRLYINKQGEIIYEFDKPDEVN